MTDEFSARDEEEVEVWRFSLFSGADLDVGRCLDKVFFMLILRHGRLVH